MYEPFAYEPLLEANRRVFGEAALPAYDIEGAEFVISFGAEFLETWISPVRYAGQWSRMHAFRGDEAVEKGIFVAVEPRLSMTASNADEWVSVKPGTEYLVALAMANVLGAGGEASEWTPQRAGEATGRRPGQRSSAWRGYSGRSGASRSRAGSPRPIRRRPPPP